MSTTHQSSGSEGDLRIPVDDRKRKRMLSNRESARRSRMRKQHHLEDLSRQGDQLRVENHRIAVKTDAIADQYINLDSENAVLRTQMLELTERLKSMNSVLRFVEEFSGAKFDIPEIPEPDTNPWKLASPAYPVMDPMPEILDPLLRPWQLPCAAQASADMFFC